MVSLFSAPTLEALLYLLKHSPQVAQVASVRGRRGAAPCRAGRFRGGAGPPRLQCKDFAGTPVCLCPDPSATLLLGDLDKLLPSSTLWFSVAMMKPLTSRPFLPFQGLLATSRVTIPAAALRAQEEALLTPKAPLFSILDLC